MTMFLLNSILLIAIICLLILLSMVWPPDSPWSPWWRTSKEKSRAICKFVKLTKKDIFYELGSGEGNTLIIAAKEFGVDAVGIEIDPIRYYFSKINVWFSGTSKKIVIKKANFFDIDLSRATVIYAYLVPKALQRLKPKFLKELPKGARIVSLNYQMNLPLQKKDEKNNLFLYTIS